jgi:cobalt-zinc-cadmium efflux system outer membrane protein
MPIGNVRRLACAGPAAHVTIAIALSAALSTSVPLSVEAQSGNHAPPLTLAAAVDLARANHPAVTAASARRQTAVALARQDAAYANPVLEWREENLGSPLPRDAFATIAQPLDISGRRLAIRASARDIDRRGIADSTTVMRDVEANAARAFWRASLARALLALAEEQRLDAERLARLEADRAREGAVAEVSAMRTSVERDRARVVEASARVSWLQAAAELARAIGVSPDSLPPVPAMAVTPLPLDAAPVLQAAVEHALATRSELSALRAAEDAARHRLTAERRAVLPDVVVQAGRKQTAGYSTSVVGVAVPLPLFNQNTPARQRATGDLELVQSERRAAEQTIRTSAAAAVESYRALLAAQPTGIDSVVARAIEVASIADAAYAVGGSSLLELLDARRARAETLTAALRWAADVRIAEIDLLRALGASPLDSLGLP